jgi:hypothetical protein
LLFSLPGCLAALICQSMSYIKFTPFFSFTARGLAIRNFTDGNTA